jgi:beta-lactamase class A
VDHYRSVAVAGMMFLLMICSSGATAVGDAMDRATAAASASTGPAARASLPEPITRAHKPAPFPPPVKLDRRALTKALDRYLDGRAGSASLAMRDLGTGNSYEYRSGHRYATASCAKVDILMTLLLRAQRRDQKPTGEQRRLAAQSIRYSDNFAADRLWESIGGASAMNAANRAFGVRDTRAVNGDCLGLHCWGITDTTAAEQLKLLKALVADDGPLSAANQRYVLDLMGEVVDEQAWGVSAAADKGDKVALKNGWQVRTAHGGLWAINSIGRVRTVDGHDFLIAVLSDHNPHPGYGIASVERVVQIAAKEFRKTSGRVPPN